MKYISLADDLTKLIESYDQNPLVTGHQRAIWRPQGKKRAITHGMLGKAHPQALRLLEQDGYDGQPVGSLSKRSAESFWYYTDNHIFPPEEDLIRLGIFMHLDVYRVLALVLKAKWEEFFAREICGWRANVGKELSQILQREAEMEEALNRFNPDTEELFGLLLIHANIGFSQKASLFDEGDHSVEPLADLTEKAMDKMLRSGVRWLVDAGYTPKTFDTLVQTMLLNRLHWAATDSPELEHFKKQSVEEIVIWSQGTDAERQEYWYLSQARLQLLMELDEMYVRLESTRLQNAATEYRYLKVFGEHEIKLKEARFRCFELEQKLLLKRANPELSAEELDAQVQQKLEELQKQLQELHKKVQDASLIEVDRSMKDTIAEIFGGSQPLTDETRTAYINECKKLLRQIYLKIHPDRLKNNPAYAKLTPKQKEELDQMFRKALEVDTDELGYSAGYIESRFRSPDGLRRVLEKINAILESAGINIDPRLEIQGKTVQERLAWLRKDIELLERDLQVARLELQAMMADEEIEQKRALLANEEKHEAIQAEMDKQIEEYEKRAAALEAELQSLLGGDSP